MAKDYSKLDKDALLKVVEKLESRKKYGLIWDEEKTKEQFEKESENALPVLKEVKGKEIKTDPSKPTNILIEGDNYHSLSVLNYTHQGKIDVIYIDPPYNTGAKDWKYNNDYVDKIDTYRHSKWLSFMSKRLYSSKKLLTEDGVLICTIDHNELATLGLLLQELFPDKEITCVTIIHNPSGIQGINFSHNNEYAYFVHRNDKKVIETETRLDDEADVRPFINGAKGNTKNYLRESGHNCFYPIFVKNNEVIGFGEVCDKNFHPKSSNIKRKNGIIEVYPIDNDGIERKWLFTRSSVDEIADELSVNHSKKKNVFAIIRTKKKINYKTVWVGNKFNAKTYGTQLLQEIINTSFPFPKSLLAVEECIKAVVHNKNLAIILDFFAGSGTTGHAVLDLNKNDNGNRQFILCTNNELNGFEKELREQGISENEIQKHGICQRITYPRIANVIKGYKTQKGEKITGLGGNLKYYKTDFVKNSISRDDLKIRITRECTEMLCLREGIFDEVKAKPDYHIFEQNGRIMAVYYALEQNGLEQLKKELDKMKGEKILYCFTLDPLGLDKNDFADWQGVNFEAIPQPILDIYKEIYNL
jgi:adenine-specific DNA-methyltransferase